MFYYLRTILRAPKKAMGENSGPTTNESKGLASAKAKAKAKAKGNGKGRKAADVDSSSEAENHEPNPKPSSKGKAAGVNKGGRPKKAASKK